MRWGEKRRDFCMDGGTSPHSITNDACDKKRETLTKVDNLCWPAWILRAQHLFPILLKSRHIRAELSRNISLWIELAEEVVVVVRTLTRTPSAPNSFWTLPNNLCKMVCRAWVCYGVEYSFAHPVVDGRSGPIYKVRASLCCPKGVNVFAILSLI